MPAPRNDAGLSEAPPPPALRGLAACRWWHDGGVAEHRVLPDGCLDILRCAEGRLWLVPTTAAAVVVPVPAAVTGLRFHPGALPRLLRLPADALGPDAGPLPLADVAPWLASAEDLDEVAARLARRRPDAEILPDRRLRLALRWLRLAAVPVERVAEAAGLSPRQFHRRCTAATGLSPKTLARVLRLQRLLPGLRAGQPAAALAAAAGFADQAHMTRDLRHLTGLTPTALAAEVRRVRFVQDGNGGAGHSGAPHPLRAEPPP